MATTIRRATLEDADQIAEIIVAVVAEPEPVIFEHALSPEEVRAWIVSQLGSAGLGLAGAGFVVARVVRGLAARRPQRGAAWDARRDGSWSSPQRGSRWPASRAGSRRGGRFPAAGPATRRGTCTGRVRG